MNDTSKRALVIGAGLAGAATCAALAGRGWSITLIDAASGPAQAASALPVGMLSPHVTRAPTPLSRLSALGVASTRTELERLVPQGQGWQACEVDNLGHDRGRWPAALVRPAALVQGWLEAAVAEKRLTTKWNTSVTHLRRSAAGWTAVGATGEAVADAPLVIVAAAFGSLDLMHASASGLDLEALPLRPVKGQMSLAAQQGSPHAQRPQRDNGVYVPTYEDSGLPPEWPRTIWAMGSTYERGDASTTVTMQAHERNAASLEALHPEAARQMRDALAAGTLGGWAQVRCASLDRLPLVGAVPDVPALRSLMGAAGSRRGRVALDKVPRIPGLFVLTALGSRGLTLAHACSQYLVSLIENEAVALEPDLLSAIDPARFAWRLARKQPA